ncbi:hypothetical protein [Micromonospora vulcania]|uniref:Uncharacterized protein n=1 Tax=Micromonospora vulcania TaxID=1441873 RepID=A0ABW1GWM4_9ACTN
MAVQRRASNSGVVMVVGPKVALGRTHAGKTVTIEVTDTDLTIHTDSGPRTVKRTNGQPVRSNKAHRPRKVSNRTWTNRHSSNTWDESVKHQVGLDTVAA